MTYEIVCITAAMWFFSLMPDNASVCWQTISPTQGEWLEDFYGDGLYGTYVGAYYGSCIHRKESITCWNVRPLRNGEILRTRMVSE